MTYIKEKSKDGQDTQKRKHDHAYVRLPLDNQRGYLISRETCNGTGPLGSKGKTPRE